jgi:hypothetical protein
MSIVNTFMPYKCISAANLTQVPPGGSLSLQHGCANGTVCGESAHLNL